MQTNSNVPLLTVGIPVYNGASTLPCALDSLLAQTFEDFQIIVSDNASTDETPEICEYYQKIDRRIQYHRNERNMGYLYNFNHLLEIAESPLFMWAADDDEWEPDFMKDLIDLLMSDHTVSLAFCAFDYTDDSTAGKRLKGADLRLRIMANRRTAFSRLALFLLLPETLRKAAMMYGITRLDTLRSVGGYYSIFDEEKGIWQDPFGADNHTVFLLGLHGRYAITNKILFHKRLKPFDVREAPPYPTMTLKDIFRSNNIYWRLIIQSRLPLIQRLVLCFFASINHGVRCLSVLTHRVLTAALTRLNLLFIVRTARRNIRTRIRGSRK